MVCSKEYYLTYNCHLTTAKKYYSKIGILSPVIIYVNIMKQELEPGMVFALEPKIVLPGIGPVGIENSWAVTTDGLEKLTLCKEEIIEL